MIISRVAERIDTGEGNTAADRYRAFLWQFMSKEQTGT